MFCLGLDIGYSNMKLALGDLGGSQPRLLLHPAGAAPVGHDHRFGHYLMRRLSRGVSPLAVIAVSVLA